MNTGEQRKAIAELLDWTKIQCYEDNAGPPILHGFPPPTLAVDKDGNWIAIQSTDSIHLPEYPTEHNACAEMRKHMPEADRGRFVSVLIRVIGKRIPGQLAVELSDFDLLDASPAAQCEAFLRLKGKWTE